MGQAYHCLSLCSESCCSFSWDRKHSLHSSVCLVHGVGGQLGLEGYRRPFNQLRPELSPQRTRALPSGGRRSNQPVDRERNRAVSVDRTWRPGGRAWSLRPCGLALPLPTRIDSSPASPYQPCPTCSPAASQTQCPLVSSVFPQSREVMGPRFNEPFPLPPHPSPPAQTSLTCRG